MNHFRRINIPQEVRLKEAINPQLQIKLKK